MPGIDAQRQQHGIERNLHEPGGGEGVPPLAIRDAHDVDAGGEPPEQVGNVSHGDAAAGRASSLDRSSSMRHFRYSRMISRASAVSSEPPPDVPPRVVWMTGAPRTRSIRRIRLRHVR